MRKMINLENISGFENDRFRKRQKDFENKIGLT